MSIRDLEILNKQDFIDIINKPSGARFIAGLVDFCGVFKDKPEGTAREIGLILYRMALDVDGGEQAYITGRKELEIILKREKE